MSSYGSGEQSYSLGAYGGSARGMGGATVPLAEQDAEKRRLEVWLIAGFILRSSLQGVQGSCHASA